MSDTSSLLLETIGSGLARDFGLFAQRLRDLVEDVSEDEFWTRPYPYGNSIGHLVLHITGNLNYYIGARIANTGYVRDREREFTDTSRPPKADVLKALDDAVAIVMQTVRAQSASEWSAPYTAVGANAADRFGNVLRCAEHFFHHLGQIIYLSREHARLRLRS